MIRSNEKELQYHVNQLGLENREIYYELLDVVCDIMDVGKSVIFTNARKGEIVAARNTFRFNFRRYTKSSNITLKTIGMITKVPAADHSTVHNSIKKWSHLINPKYNDKQYRLLQNRINDSTIQMVGQIKDIKPFMIDGIGFNTLEDVRNILKELNIDFDFSYFNYKLD